MKILCKIGIHKYKYIKTIDWELGKLQIYKCEKCGQQCMREIIG